MSYYTIYAPTVSFPLCSVSVGRRMTLEAAQTLAGNYPGSKIVEYWDNPVENVIGPVRADRGHDMPTPPPPTSRRAMSREEQDEEEIGEDGMALVQALDGSFSLAPRTTELASVGLDPFRTAGNLGKLTADQKRVQQTYRDNAQDHDAASDVFTRDDDDGARRAGRGYRIVDSERTQAPVGRPKLGTKDAGKAELVLVERTGHTMNEMRTTLGRGKRPPDWLTRAVAEILTEHRATDVALAEALGYADRSSIHRLARRSPQNSASK
jgi:hypothetical protein